MGPRFRPLMQSWLILWKEFTGNITWTESSGERETPTGCRVLLLPQDNCLGQTIVYAHIQQTPWSLDELPSVAVIQVCLWVLNRRADLNRMCQDYSFPSEVVSPFVKSLQVTLAFGEGNGNPFQYPCLENPTDRGAWQATVHVVAKSQTRLSDFTLL